MIVTITPRTNSRNLMGTFLAAEGEADYFTVSVYMLCYTCADVHHVDSIERLPCLRSATHLAEMFCVKHGVDEYNLDWRVDSITDLSDMAGVKQTHNAYI